MSLNAVLAAGANVLPKINPAQAASVVSRNILPEAAKDATKAFAGAAARNGSSAVENLSSLGFA